METEQVNFDQDYTETMKDLGISHPFWGAVTVSCIIIFISELFDKVSFYSDIFHDCSTNTLALSLMTLIGVAFGVAASQFIPQWIFNLFASLLFVIFAILYFKEACEKHEDFDEGFDEAKEALEKKHLIDEDDTKKVPLLGSSCHKHSHGEKKDSHKEEKHCDNLEEQHGEKTEEQTHFFVTAKQRQDQKSQLYMFGQTLTLVFCAEWGDKTQLSTIALSAQFDPYGIFIGCTLGFALVNIVAIAMGFVLAKKLSPVTVNTIAGLMFLGFGIYLFITEVEHLWGKGD